MHRLYESMILRCFFHPSSRQQHATGISRTSWSPSTCVPPILLRQKFALRLFRFDLMVVRFLVEGRLKGFERGSSSHIHSIFCALVSFSYGVRQSVVSASRRYGLWVKSGKSLDCCYYVFLQLCEFAMHSSAPGTERTGSLTDCTTYS